MNITVYFFNNPRWVLFNPDYDVVITVYFFTTLHGCSLFLIVICTSLVFFFTTVDAVYSRFPTCNTMRHGRTYVP